MSTRNTRNPKGIEEMFSKLEDSVNNCKTDVMEMTYLTTMRLSSLKNVPEYYDRLVDLSEKFIKECKCIKK